MHARHESEEVLRTIDHEEIREWVEERDGRPSVTETTLDDEDSGILRVDFGSKEENLEEVSWKEFFAIFEESELAFVFQEHAPDGEHSFFCKFVPRTDADEAARSAAPAAEGLEEEDDDDDDFATGEDGE